MEENSKEKCPVCKSENVKNTGGKTFQEEYIPGRAASLSKMMPVYICQDCKRTF